MAWKFVLDARAGKELSKLAKPTQQMLLDYLMLQVLGRSDPRSLGKPLRHEKYGLWRYRVDKYRIICHIQDDILTILVLQIAKRDAVYKS